MFILRIFLVAGISLLVGCSSSHFGSEKGPVRFTESVVLAGESPAKLAFPPVSRKGLTVRSSYPANGKSTVQYEEGKDFLLDRKRGEIRRTAQSRIPDFRTNMLFGIEDFDHGKFPGFGNNKFFAYVDYAPKGNVDWPKQARQTEFLPKTQQKLVRGEKLKIVAFGDSITAGGDATEPRLIYWQRWADGLQQRYPQARVDAINGATGGDSTPQGLHRLQEKVIAQKPDLVLLGFGMNDHNIGGFGTPLPAFGVNLGTLIDRIRKETGAEVIVLSTFPPNPKWHYGSHNMEAYAKATEKVAREKGCAYVDVYQNWVAIEAKKKPEDLLANNINHPNDFGHWIYFELLNRLGL